MWSIQNYVILGVFQSMNYNILNIVVNTEPIVDIRNKKVYYNILNIVVNTERKSDYVMDLVDYNILNIVVNTEPNEIMTDGLP